RASSIRPRAAPTLSPYTTLFRSGAIAVGVAGGTGSGKTTLTRALLERFGNRSTVLFMDNYYKAHVGKTFAQRAAQNFDAPEAFEDRKSTRLNSSHVSISYAVFCL